MALTITFVLRDFAEWTSIPGPVQIIYALNSFIRFLWVIIWLALFGIFVYQFYLIIDKLLEQDAQIDISFEFQKLKFPAITICSENPYKLPTIKNDFKYEDISHLVHVYSKLLQSRHHNIANDSLLFTNASTPSAKEQWARELLRMLAVQIPEYHRARLSYKFSEIVRHCTFNGKECNRNDFILYIDDTYGACFRFNSNNDSSHVVSRAGAMHGLRMILTSMRITHEGTQLYLPITKTSGIRFSAEYEGEFPIMDTFGENLMPGHVHYVSLKLYETELMSKPYGQCSNEVKDNPYNFYNRRSYELSDCVRSCNQQRAINYCGCADPRYRAPPRTSYCGVDKFHCLIRMRGQLSDHIFNALHDCNCPPTCHKYIVEKEISSSSYSSSRNLPKSTTLLTPQYQTHNYIKSSLGYFSAFANTVPFSANEWLNIPRNISLNRNTFYQDQTISNEDTSSFYKDITCINSKTIALFGGDISVCRRWFRENSLVLYAFYKTLNVEKHSQKSSYSISQASNDLGGQVSLWLGASVISVMEIITLVIMIVLFFVHGRNVCVIPTIGEYNKDSRYWHIQELKSELDAHEIMDQELLARIERHRRSQNAQRAELQRQLREAEIMKLRAVQEVAIVNAAFTEDPSDPRRRAKVANARAILQATERHHHNVRSEISAHY